MLLTGLPEAAEVAPKSNQSSQSSETVHKRPKCVFLVNWPVKQTIPTPRLSCWQIECGVENLFQFAPNRLKRERMRRA
jgi:hypothetical protein